MSAWTPGPWMVEPIAGGETYQVTTTEQTEFTVIAETLLGDAVHHANARLIAAAPELYAALEKARNTLAGCHMANIAADICDAALAKARGE